MNNPTQSTESDLLEELRRQLAAATAELEKLRRKGRKGKKFPPNKGTLGGAIQAIREEKGLTQREVVAKAGGGICLLSFVERGKGSPSITTLVKIAGGLGVPLSAIVARWESEQEAAR